MSTRAWFDFDTEPSLSIRELGTALVAAGWTLSIDGGVTYSIDHDFATRPSEDWPQVLEALSSVESESPVAIVALIEDTGHGGTWLRVPEGRLGFSADYERQLLAGHNKVTDVGWYLPALLKVFESVPVQLVGIGWSDCYL